MNKQIFSLLMLCVLAVRLAHAGEVTPLCTVVDSTIEVSEVNFCFKLADIKHMKVLNVKSASVHLEFKKGGLPPLHIITTDESKVTGGINRTGGYEKLGVRDIDGFFQKLTDTSNKGEYLDSVKKVFNITDEQKLKINRFNHTTLYTLIDNMNGEDIVYIHRKNDPRILMLVSDLNDAQLQSIYSSILY